MAGGHPTQSTNKGPWIRGHWLWLLANQLYWPTSKSITPTFCFGFAVDGGGGEVSESVACNFRSIPKKCHCGQAGAERDGRSTYAGKAIRDRDARQAGAIIEGHIPDTGNAVRNRDARQAGAV